MTNIEIEQEPELLHINTLIINRLLQIFCEKTISLTNVTATLGRLFCADDLTHIILNF